MANAGIDANNVKTLIALLNTDGLTITNIVANPTSHSLSYSDGTTGANNGSKIARDENFTPVAFAKSNAGDGALVPLYADSNGKLLIKSS